MNANASQVLTALRANTEGCEDNGFKSVYLDNARPNGMSVTTFRAALRSLSLAGLYKVLDGEFFGMVKVSD